MAKTAAQAASPAGEDWRRPLRNAGKLGAGRAVQAVSSIAYLALAARTLGPEGFGALALIHSLCLAISQLSRFRTCEIFVKLAALPHRRQDAPGLQRCLRFSLALDIAGAGMALALVAALMPLAAAGPFGLEPGLARLATLYGFGVVAAVNLSETALGALRLLDRFGTLARQSAVEPLVRLAGAGALFAQNGRLEHFLAVWLLAVSLNRGWLAAQACQSLRRGGWLTGFRLRTGEPLTPEPGAWKFAFGSHAIGALHLFRLHAPMLAAGVFLGPASAGLLKVAQQFADLLSRSHGKLLVPSVLPELARLTAANERKRRRRVVAKTAVWVTGVWLAGFGLLALFGRPLIGLVAGPDFERAYPTMLWLAAAGVVAAASFALEPLLLASGQVGKSLKAGSAALVLYALLLPWLIHAFALQGVGMASLAFAGLQAAFLGIVSRELLSAAPLEPPANAPPQVEVSQVGRAKIDTPEAGRYRP